MPIHHDRHWESCTMGIRGPKYYFQILCTARLEQNQAHTRVLDEGGENDQVTSFVLWVLVADRTSIPATKEPKHPQKFMRSIQCLKSQVMIRPGQL